MKKDYSLVLFESQSGALSAKLESGDGSCIHLHSLVDPEQESTYFNTLSIWGDCIILAGTGLGYHLSQQLQTSLIGKTIIILEYYSKCAEISASLIEKGTGKKPCCITTEITEPEAVLSRQIFGNRMIQIIKHPVSYNVHKSFYDNLIISLYHKPEIVSTDTAVVLYGNFFLQQEVCNAAIQAGSTLEKINYNQISDVIDYEQQLQSIIAQKSPSMMMSINMLGIDGNGIFSEYSSRHDIPVAVWFVDDPRPILLSQQEFITKNMIAFCWERAYIDELITAGFQSVHYLPLATDPDLFSATGRDVQKNVELGFVGTSMGGEFRRALISKFLWNKNLEPLVNTAASAILETPGLDVDQYIATVCDSNKQPLPFTDKRNKTWFRSYIIHTAGMIKRKMLIDSLNNLGVQIFGDCQGWKELCGDSIICHPAVSYRTALADIYRSTIVNVNVTSCQMQTAVNQRVFDIPSCGGFLLSDNQMDLNELFETDEVAVYHSQDELRELARFYLHNEGARNDIAARARKRIISEHTYKERYKKIQIIINSL